MSRVLSALESLREPGSIARSVAGSAFRGRLRAPSLDRGARTQLFSARSARASTRPCSPPSTSTPRREQAVGDGRAGRRRRGGLPGDALGSREPARLSSLLQRRSGPSPLPRSGSGLGAVSSSPNSTRSRSAPSGRLSILQRLKSTKPAYGSFSDFVRSLAPTIDDPVARSAVPQLGAPSSCRRRLGFNRPSHQSVEAPRPESHSAIRRVRPLPWRDAPGSPALPVPAKLKRTIVYRGRKVQVDD